MSIDQKSTTIFIFYFVVAREKRGIFDNLFTPDGHLNIPSCESKSVELTRLLINEANSTSRWATVDIELTNFGHWNLIDATEKLLAGAANKSFSSTAPGCKSALYAAQEGYAGTTEGIVTWSVAQNGKECLVYWRVDSKQKVSMIPNLIGAYCGSKLNVTKASRDVVKDGKSGALENLVSGFARTKGARVQTCQPRFCLTAIISVGNKAKVLIDLIPRSFDDWADNLKDQVNQPEIDYIISKTVSDVSTDGSSFINWVMLLIYAGIVIFGTGILGCCCKKLGCCSKTSKYDPLEHW